ncbi:MAG: hypothetical protein PHO91_03840 [Patescibacteria group bacterium]|nr:hypothetical protein [Patescibacteria group bacterium]
MNNSLSKKLNLRINDYPISLGAGLDLNNLNVHKIKKPGFFMRLMFKSFIATYFGSGEYLWAKNCEFKYINDGGEDVSKPNPNMIIPNLGIQSGADMMWGTSAFLFYKDEKLQGFIFQIINNEVIAKICLDRFEKAIESIIGSYQSADTKQKIWIYKDQKLILRYPNENIKHGNIHLLFNE